MVLKQCGSDQGSQRPPEAATAQQMPGRDAYLDGLLACEAEAAIEGSPALAAMPVLVHAGRRAGGRRAARPPSWRPATKTFFSIVGGKRGRHGAGWSRVVRVRSVVEVTAVTATIMRTQILRKP